MKFPTRKALFAVSILAALTLVGCSNTSSPTAAPETLPLPVLTTISTEPATPTTVAPPVSTAPESQTSVPKPPSTSKPSSSLVPAERVKPTGSDSSLPAVTAALVKAYNRVADTMDYNTYMNTLDRIANDAHVRITEYMNDTTAMYKIQTATGVSCFKLDTSSSTATIASSSC